MTRWEQIEPLQHRVPLPAKVCDAITAVALSWNWFRFGLVLQICLRGILRVGEVISATREDLVLPSDLLSEHVDKIYVRVAKPRPAAVETEDNNMSQSSMACSAWPVKAISEPWMDPRNFFLSVGKPSDVAGMKSFLHFKSTAGWDSLPDQSGAAPL